MQNLGKALLALAAAGLAILSLAYRHFAPGVETVSAWPPLQAASVYIAAPLLLAAGAGLFLPRTAAASVLLLALYDAAWALIALCRALTVPPSFGAWYPACEALSALAGPAILYLLLRRQAAQPQTAAASHTLRAAQIVFALTCIFYGASHFAYADYTAAMVPAWLPPRLQIAWLTGLCHIAAGLGIILRLLPYWASLLETIMMSLFGLLVWVPTFFADPVPKWARSPQLQWSELAVNLVLVASACCVAASLKRPTST